VKFETAQTNLQMLSARLHYLLLMSIGLLISNIFLVWLVGWSFMHQKRVITPPEITQAFTISESSVDASYLRQMALFFIAERLNIAPNNITQNHDVVLQHTDSRFYHEFVGILEQEKEAVIKQNISSVFYPEEVIPNPKELKVLIKGTLAHWVGATALNPVKKNYLITFTYKSGNLKIKSFAEIPETQN
jgi:conjugal transfer pilus assembly protein TraE